MPYDPQEHRRRSIRLPGYDYSTPGAYFVTTVTHGRLCLFGQVVDAAMRLNDAGRMVEQVWRGLSERFPSIALDAFVVMPNHLHGIIVITEQGAEQGIRTGGEYKIRPYGGSDDDPENRRGEPRVRPEYEHPTGTAPETIGRIVQACKSLTTVEYTRGAKRSCWPPFERQLWQRSFYDHITRHDDDLFVKRRYIADNPLRWADDEENPNLP